MSFLFKNKESVNCFVINWLGTTLQELLKQSNFMKLKIRKDNSSELISHDQGEVWQNGELAHVSMTDKHDEMTMTRWIGKEIEKIYDSNDNEKD